VKSRSENSVLKLHTVLGILAMLFVFGGISSVILFTVCLIFWEVEDELSWIERLRWIWSVLCRYGSCILQEVCVDYQVIPRVNSSVTVSHNLNNLTVDRKNDGTSMNSDTKKLCNKECNILQLDNACQTNNKDVVLISAVNIPSTSTCSNNSQTTSREDDGMVIEELDLVQIQDSDRNLKLVKDMILEGVKPTWQEVSKYDVEVKYYWARLDSLVVKNNVLYRKWEDANCKEKFKLLILIPRSHREDVLKQLHNNKTAAHLGVKKTLRKVRDRYFWYALRKDVENWCKTCDVCNCRRGTLRKPKAPLTTYNVGYPNERIAIDFMGPFVKTKSGNKYMMVVGDVFSKWTECYAIENLESCTVAKTLVNKYISKWGCPLICHTDQGKSFKSKLFIEVCQLLGIEKNKIFSFSSSRKWFYRKTQFYHYQHALTLCFFKSR